MVNIVISSLTRDNEKKYREIFQKSFKNERWSTAVPFPKDAVYTASLDDGTVLGFCMLHAETPYAFKYGAGSFIYNLCVAPDYRGRGVASAIVQKVLADAPRCYAHSFVEDDKLNMWFVKRGWTFIGVFRELYSEYCIGFPEAETVEKNYIRTDHYDMIENVIYCQ